MDMQTVHERSRIALLASPNGYSLSLRYYFVCHAETPSNTHIHGIVVP